ncbi:MAG: type IV pilus assembly protein PilM [Planctomycetia bacterium]|nr:type IV pilus assembly protein PilM [Planctomycetia bacterium]
MARSPYVWGIDIGKSALKAMRCRMAPDSRRLVVEAFDYVEYPMLLTQPDADPVELVRAALQEFTTRNNLRGDRVAVAVPGQSGLSKFIKLPPIEAKKIADIVKYEARQQIPFPLEQVRWDWQRLAGGMEENGFVIDAEVAIFAIKREQVFKAIEPLIHAGIAVDVLQLAPIALANMAMFDQLPDPATIDPDKPPPSIVLVSTGVDSTDLVVTNGLRIWQRSMPIGGSNFTKALVQGMKLTFAKAEHLKRNAVRAEDPKQVFTIMRPVFNEFASELQRSLNYFTGSDRTATIGKVLLLGNATKLRGLTDFVGKQLQLDVQRLDHFRALDASAIAAAPAFRENRLAFGTAYGLALQAAEGAFVRTNLLPTEIIKERLIEAKKPWAVGALVGLLASAVIAFAGTYAAWTSYDPQLYQNAFDTADGVKKRSEAAIASLSDVRQKQEAAVSQQQYLLQAENRRFQALEMMRAVESLLPADEPGKSPENPADRRELHVDRMDCQYFPDLATWFAGVRPKWEETHAPEDTGEDVPHPPAGNVAADQTAAPVKDVGGPAPPTAPGASPGPSGPGWVVEIAGHHFHNEDRHKPDESAQFVRSTIVKNLLGEGRTVAVSAGPLVGQNVPVSRLGIGFPVIVSSSPIQNVKVSAPQRAGSDVGRPATPDAAVADAREELSLKRHDFVLQFSWQPTVPTTP